MKIVPNIAARIAATHRLHTKLRAVFDSFVAQLDYFASDKCEVPGVSISANAGSDTFTASLSTVRLAFTFVVQRTDAASRGHVVCVKEAPSFSDEVRILGSFSFDVQGLADIEVAPGEDPVDLNYAAVEVVLCFLDLALKLPPMHGAAR